jgi:hypothetical protein
LENQTGIEGFYRLRSHCLLVSLVEVPKVRLYVKSLKKAAGVENVVIDKPSMQNLGGGRAGNILRVYPTHEVRTVTKYEYALPEEQEHLVEIIKEAALQFGLKLEITDVGRENVLHRAIQKEFEKIRLFPTLVSDSGMMLEGTSTKEQIEAYLSKVKRAPQS